MYTVDFEQILVQNKIDDDRIDYVPPETLRSWLKVSNDSLANYFVTNMAT